MKSLPLGTRVDGDRLIIDADQIEADRGIPSDLRSAKIVQSVANTISHFIKVTIDAPSQHTSTFMPLLDIQAKMVNDRIIYKFYNKETSKQTVIHASSALPANTKRHALVNEGLRRLRLTDRSLPWSEVEDVMSRFSNMLRASGYMAQFRGEVIEAAMKGFHRQCDAADSGTGPPLFRPQGYESERRRNKKLMSQCYPFSGPKWPKYPQIIYSCTGHKHTVFGGAFGGRSGVICGLFRGHIARF